MPASAEEQYLLELINDARLDPLGDASRYISTYSPLTARQGDIQDAIDYFGVSGSNLLQAYSDLTPAQPLAWNDSLATSARQHDAAMISDDTQAHQLPGEAAVPTRAEQAGYPSDFVGENIYAYSEDALYAHAGFMIDWGNAEPGHRTNIMDADYRDVGVGILNNTNSDPEFGPQVVTEDFGSTFTPDATVLGVAYNDRDGDDFYSVGEGVGGLGVSVAGSSTTSASSGGYALQTSATGPQQVTLTGAGLSGSVEVGVDLTAGDNVKLDVVDGTTLRTSTSATVSGPIARVEGLGETGLLIATGAGAQTIVGTSGSDTITGGADSDTIVGRVGDDVLLGNQGNDIIAGGQNEDAIAGGQGSDSVFGNLGDDTLAGNLGNDYLHGGQGDDLVYGGQGADTLLGGLGDNTLIGGLGPDTYVISASPGADLIQGFNQASGDRIDLGGQSYSLGSAADGSALISLSGGHTVDVAGLTPNQINAGIFTAAHA